MRPRYIRCVFHLTAPLQDYRVGIRCSLDHAGNGVRSSTIGRTGLRGNYSTPPHVPRGVSVIHRLLLVFYSLAEKSLLHQHSVERIYHSRPSISLQDYSRGAARLAFRAFRLRLEEHLPLSSSAKFLHYDITIRILRTLLGTSTAWETIMHGRPKPPPCMHRETTRDTR